MPVSGRHIGDVIQTGVGVQVGTRDSILDVPGDRSWRGPTRQILQPSFACLHSAEKHAGTVGLRTKIDNQHPFRGVHPRVLAGQLKRQIALPHSPLVVPDRVCRHVSCPLDAVHRSRLPGHIVTMPNWWERGRAQRSGVLEFVRQEPRADSRAPLAAGARIARIRYLPAATRAESSGRRGRFLSGRAAGCRPAGSRSCRRSRRRPRAARAAPGRPAPPRAASRDR